MCKENLKKPILRIFGFHSPRHCYQGSILDIADEVLQLIIMHIIFLQLAISGSIAS